ncbi:MAG: hypothetical protein ACTHKX_00260, partial [Pseudolysinimonas sp.]
LETCAKCTIVAEEVEEVGSHLAMVMLPLLLGGIAGGTLLSQLSAPSSASAAELIPAMPQSVEAVATGGAAAGSALAGAFSLGGAAGTSAVLGGLAVAVVLGAGVAVGTVPQAEPAAPPVVVAAQDTDPAESVGQPAGEDPIGPSPTDIPSESPDAGGAGSGSNSGGAGTVGTVVNGVTDTVGEVVGGVVDTVGETVTDVTEVVQQPVVLTVSASGTGTPGASVSLQAAGTVYATTTVGSNGKYSISAGGIPETVGSLSLVQKVDQSLLGGLINGVLQVLKPLTISSSSGGLPVIAVG